MLSVLLGCRKAGLACDRRTDRWETPGTDDKYLRRTDNGSCRDSSTTEGPEAAEDTTDEAVEAASEDVSAAEVSEETASAPAEPTQEPAATIEEAAPSPAGRSSAPAKASPPHPKASKAQRGGKSRYLVEVPLRFRPALHLDIWRWRR